MNSSLTVVIPAYNDEATIETVLRKTATTAMKLHIPFTILVANDASRDQTGQKLEKLRKLMPNLRVITHRYNLGYGTTIRELYENAPGSWVFSLPGDYQIEPKELTALWRKRDTADMLIGWRNKRNDSSIRLLQSNIYNSLLRLLFHLPLHDANSVRLMRSRIIKKIRLRSSSAFVDAELAIKAIQAGFRVIEAPISHRAREGGGGGGGKMTTIFPTIVDMIVFWMKQPQFFAI